MEWLQPAGMAPRGIPLFVGWRSLKKSWFLLLTLYTWTHGDNGLSMSLVFSHSASTCSALMEPLVTRDTMMAKVAPDVMATMLPVSMGNSWKYNRSSGSWIRFPFLDQAGRQAGRQAYLSSILDESGGRESAGELGSIWKPRDHPAQTTTDHAGNHAWWERERGRESQFESEWPFTSCKQDATRLVSRNSWQTHAPDAVALAQRMESAIGTTLEAIRIPVK